MGCGDSKAAAPQPLATGDAKNLPYKVRLMKESGLKIEINIRIVKSVPVQIQ
jgi:hypothetical protein